MQTFRPRTLTMAGVPVVVGTALTLAHGHDLNLPVLTLTLVVAVMIQIATNLFNDAMDAIRGVDDAETRLGPPRAVASGLLPAQQVLWAARLMLGTAFALGLYLIWLGGWPIAAIGLSAIVAAWAYSAGPAPVSSGPVGEVFVLVYFGLAAVAGTYYLQVGEFHPDAWLVGLVLGLPAAAVLLVNNYRDAEGDARAGRRTLAIVLGPTGSRWLYLLMMLASLTLCLLVSDQAASLPWRLLPWILLPLALLLGRRLFVRPVGAWLNDQLAATSAFQILLGVLLCLSWWLTG